MQPSKQPPCKFTVVEILITCFCYFTRYDSGAFHSRRISREILLHLKFGALVKTYSCWLMPAYPLSAKLSRSFHRRRCIFWRRQNNPYSDFLSEIIWKSQIQAQDKTVHYLCHNDRQLP